MPDIVKILPTEVSNKIAAGEVVQRPSSVLKELLENSVDANSSKITIIVKNAGKNLIQVIDDGDGMSRRDMRSSFVKHATSKINKIDDVFSISSMGFRGEALAAISSVSPNLLSGIFANIFSVWSDVNLFVISVWIKPGAIILTVILRVPTSRANDFENPITPALAAA